MFKQWLTSPMRWHERLIFGVGWGALAVASVLAVGNFVQAQGNLPGPIGQGGGVNNPALVSRGVHVRVSGPVPTSTAALCGTGFAFQQGSTDVAGTVIPGSANTSCQINFANVWANIPFCVVHSQSSTISYVLAPGYINVTSVGAGVAIDWFCVEPS